MVYLGLMVSLLLSCKKENSNLANNTEKEFNYMPLQIGNYWVYKNYDIDSVGNETDLNKIDSVIIKRDTIINTKQYFVLEGTNYPFRNGKWGIIEIIRDSAGCIIDHNGKVKFSPNNFADTLASKIDTLYGDTLDIQTYRMEKITNLVTVPAGEFSVLNFKGTVVTPLKNPGIQNPRYLNNLYANHVGRVLETYFFLSSPIISEKRLYKYHVLKE